MNAIKQALLATAAAACVLPATAGASQICVPTFAACPGGVGDAQTANLETAVQTSRTDGQADTVYMDAGYTYTDTQTLDPSGTDDLTVTGKGTTSVITSSTNLNAYVVNLTSAAASVTLKNLRIVIPASMIDNGGAGIQTRQDTLDNVEVESQNPGSSAVPSVLDGGNIKNSHIFATGIGTIYKGIDVNAFNGTGALLVQDTKIENTVIAVSADVASIPVTVRRSQIIDPTQLGVAAYQGGQATVENSYFHVAGSGVALDATSNSAAGAGIAADHVTAIRTGGLNAPAVEAQVLNVAGYGNATATAKNSIFRGFQSSWNRQAPVGVTKGDAFVTVAYSNGPQAGGDAGDGVLTAGPGNIDQDPLFAGAQDFHLTGGSPSIDTGDPAAGGNAGPDLDGLTRLLDGNGDCAARRDMGAYEFQGGQGNCQQIPPPDPQPPGAQQNSGGSAGSTQPAPGFGSDPLIKLPAKAKVKRGKVILIVKNGNTFQVDATAPGAKPFKLGAKGSAKLELKVAKRARKLRVKLTVTDPRGQKRVVAKTLKIKR